MNEVYIASYELDAQGIMQAVDQEQLLNYSDAAQDGTLSISRFWVQV